MTAFSFCARIDIELWKNPNGLRVIERQRAKRILNTAIDIARRADHLIERAVVPTNFVSARILAADFNRVHGAFSGNSERCAMFKIGFAGGASFDPKIRPFAFRK